MLRAGWSSRSAKTVRNIHGVLSAALVDARRWKLLSTNAATGALLPALKWRAPRAWNAKQLTRFLERVEHEWLAPRWRFLGRRLRGSARLS